MSTKHRKVHKKKKKSRNSQKLKISFELESILNLCIDQFGMIQAKQTEKAPSILELCLNQFANDNNKTFSSQYDDNKLFIGSNYISRIINLLQIQDNNTDKRELYDLVCCSYPGKGVNTFIEDYHEYVQNVDKNKVYITENGHCDLRNCIHIQRQYRNQSIYDNDSNARFELYNCCTSQKSEKCVVICQMLDVLHIMKFHLVDLGLRYINNHDHLDGDEMFHKQLVRMKTDLSKKRAIFSKIRNDISDDYKIGNKFVTQITYKNNKNSKKRGGNKKHGKHKNKKNKKNTKNKKNKKNKKSDHMQFAFGFRFFYHSFYKQNEFNDYNSIDIPGAPGFFDHGNYEIDESYTIGDWYVSPTHKSMKDEVLHGKIQQISIIQYKNTLQKAILKLNGLKHIIAGSLYYFSIIYDIKTNSPITLKHILSVLFYTNFTQLSSEFSKTFRRLTELEDVESVKRRHSEYANWGKYLRETIECWGTISASAKSSLQYHGISCKMLFAGLETRFYAPTSTTLQYSTAVMFANQGAGDGIVITIANSWAMTQFFDCVSWSDFPGESERLFVGGFRTLKICGLTEIDKGINYDKWMKAMQIFSTGFINGKPSPHKLLSEDIDLIKLLIHDFLDKKNNNASIPSYIRQLWANVLNKTESIEICPNVLNKDIHLDYYSHVYSILPAFGYKMLRYIYFDEDNRLNWNMIKQLFPHLRNIYVGNLMQMKYNKHTVWNWGPTILVTDALLLSILINMVSNQWNMLMKIGGLAKKIQIHCPLNSIDSLDSLIKKHISTFNKLGYELSRESIDITGLGAITESFCIYPIDSG